MPREKAGVGDGASITIHPVATADETGLIHADRRHPYYIGSDVTELGMPEMLFEGEVLPAEQYVVPEDRIIQVHPAHEALVVRHGGTVHHVVPVDDTV